jgi:hypothetical protein
MGTYNQTFAELRCPRCGGTALMEVDLHFGYTREMQQVAIGDPYPFLPRKAVHNGGYPTNGNIDGEGYVICPLCEKDFFVTAVVRGGVLTAVEVDVEKSPHVP